MKFVLSAFSRGLAVGVAFAALSATAFAQDTGITVYNAQHESLTQEWADGFTKETGIAVTIRQGSDLEVGNQILQEGANSPAAGYPRPDPGRLPRR